MFFLNDTNVCTRKVCLLLPNVYYSTTNNFFTFLLSSFFFTRNQSSSIFVHATHHAPHRQHVYVHVVHACDSHTCTLHRCTPMYTDVHRRTPMYNTSTYTAPEHQLYQVQKRMQDKIKEGKKKSQYFFSLFYDKKQKTINPNFVYVPIQWTATNATIFHRTSLHGCQDMQCNDGNHIPTPYLRSGPVFRFFSFGFKYIYHPPFYRELSVKCCKRR